MQIRKKHEKAQNKVDISQNINLVAPAMSKKAQEMNLTAPLKNVESSKDVEMS